MKLIEPSFYKEFNCTASMCKHNCCIGWEIDIDESTLDFYSKVGGSFGGKIKNNIDVKGTPHFILGSDERCPFLNDKNLCDVIINLGQDRLCQVCTDHPRFRTYLPDRVEVGLGLCCEEATRLLLSNNMPLNFYSSNIDSEDEELDESYNLTISLRDKIISMLQNRSLSIEQRINNLLADYGVEWRKRGIDEWVGVLLGLERLDDAWTQKLSELKLSNNLDIKGFKGSSFYEEYRYEHIVVYMIYRHFMESLYDNDIISKIKFAVLSYKIILSLDALKWQKDGNLSIDDCIENIRSYSSEIEYSDENMSILYDYL